MVAEMNRLREIANSLEAVPELIRMCVRPDGSIGSRALLGTADSLDPVAQALRNAADAIERDVYAYWWRRLERDWRKIGKYDSADAARQIADSIESGGVHRDKWCSIKIEVPNATDVCDVYPLAPSLSGTTVHARRIRCGARAACKRLRERIAELENELKIARMLIARGF
jgi:hypothetical protein